MYEKNVERLAYYTTSIGLLYVVLGMLSGLYLGYMIAAGNLIPDYMSSAHSHILCLGILILVVGLAMKSWARETREKKIVLTSGRLKSAQVSVFLLALGTIVAFISDLTQMSLSALTGYILFFIGFLMVTIGWISGGKIR